jgi:hypothetical protein
MTATTEAAAPLSADGPRPRRWWANKVFLVPAAVIAVAVVTVVVDLPAYTTRGSQISDARGIVQQVNSYVAPCSFAVGETLSLYADLEAHSLAKGQQSQVPGLLNDDQSACSFTDDSIYQLSTLQVPGTQAGKALGQLVATVTLWATADALSVIEAVQVLDVNPSDPAARRSLAKNEALMTKDRARAQAELGVDNRLLRTELPALKLAQVA